ncbi:MAG: Coenzyme F420 hydrogenase/dehydrogenase, beta subunit C-terminal domain [Prevotellaceae bacterium]|nr:Coenzyme F420 hydrogenase/dehydrogenase, beta subunit C-terminal domain [Prevotellaceae bacterium]
MGKCFHEIQSHLKEGRYVLYTGTPCQCEGLRRFLRRDYETLFIIDILCHSVPSPRILRELLQNYGGNFEKISFRNKDLGWRTSYQVRMFRGKEVLFNDTYLTMFFKGLINRPSCYSCKFTNTHRSGDITIGDYWNINSVIPEFEDSLGVSCLFVNNEKGKTIFENIKSTLDCFETELQPALQTCMMRNVTEPKDRKYFWRDYSKYGLKYCEAKYGRMTIWERFRDRTIAPFVRKIGIAAFFRKIR